jgi:beta-glucosidase
MSGSALAVNWAKQNANAIIQAWYPGEEGGAAIAETITGENNPAGRLPVTFYKGVEQLPEFTDYSMARRTYRYFSGEPLYSFGYGLSYSKFAYSRIKLSNEKIKAGEPLKVEAQIANTSEREGDEVVQVYVTFPKIPGAPLRALRGFMRIHLRARESKTVQFMLDDRDLSHVNNAGDRMVGSGKYKITVGGGQPGVTADTVTAGFEIQGRQKLPR